MEEDLYSPIEARRSFLKRRRIQNSASRISHGSQSFDAGTFANLTWRDRYADVLHEIKPVTDGYRLVLTYNLIRMGGHGPISAELVSEEKVAFTNCLKEWKRCHDARQPTFSKLAYVLEHRYSEASLRLSQLKGRDRVLGRYLKQICNQEQVTLVLASMTLTVYDANDS